MATQDDEPTAGELWRVIRRVEESMKEVRGELRDGITELRSELREVVSVLRGEATSRALLTHRVEQLEAGHADQETRLRLAMDDLAARKKEAQEEQKAAERERRVNRWIMTALSALAIGVTLVFNLLKGS
ncbi:hypothetical protein SAMN05421505_12098 [Sinosporangium album]|uniref:Uncharacterized protein n=1 Tax=Sinosporangium album TaxID=504805 RepID=A0A1G8EGX2_9ACTN|nr:hypothetical protein [Sinosporangium album]SDH69183.1 hypothetical protein SAMN05421505_12098 [Sinosporangium album]